MATQKKCNHAKKGEDLLIDDVKGSKQAQEVWMPAAWFAENLPFYKVDEPFLRRLAAAANVNPHTKAPWIPAPVKSKWPVHRTLAGIAAWFWHRSENGAGFPETFPSQKDFVAQTGLPIALLDHLRQKSFKVILPGSRVDFREVLKSIAKLNVDKMDVIDGDYEENRLTRERADEQAMLNAEKRGELLFSQDRQLAVSEIHCTEVLFEQFLAPFKKELFEDAKRNGYLPRLAELWAKHLAQLPPEMTAQIQPAEANA